ncbi:MAG: hypothetical protein M3423_08375, partial [Actinomycetota bacterium]|nr:hypothetical protein [Actinomycetota bacterium]
MYEDVLRILGLFASAAGRLPRTTEKLIEVDFRNFALLVLNSNYETSTARGEVFNGEGKTDLLVPWEGRNAFIGELKVWAGKKSVSAAVDQLLSYSTWQDTNAALVLIIRSASPTRSLESADRAIRSHGQFVAALTG